MPISAAKRASHRLPSTFMITVTPFNDRNEVDEKLLRIHLRRMKVAGVGVYLIGSGSGEGYSLSREERSLVMTVGREELQGHVPVRAMGCERHLVEDMIGYVREVEAHRLDAVHVYSLDMGHGAKPTRGEMVAYYNAVIEATSLPVVLSSHHAAGYMLPVDLVEELVDRFEQIIGIVCASSKMADHIQMVDRLADRIEVHCGGPAHGPNILALGGAGFLSNESNLKPELAANIVAACTANDFEGMRVNYTKLMALFEINQRYGGSSMRAMKPLMRRYGFDGGVLRSPRQPADKTAIDLAVAEINKLGIFEEA